MTSEQRSAADPSPAQLENLLAELAAELRHCPDDVHVRLKLAEVLRLLGRRHEAITFYSNVAWTQALAGNLAQAIAVCTLILELSPDHRETQDMLAKLYASERVREAKRSVPVQQVGGRWVMDPRRRESPAASVATKVETSEEPPPVSAAQEPPPVSAAQEPPPVSAAPRRPTRSTKPYAAAQSRRAPQQQQQPPAATAPAAAPPPATAPDPAPLPATASAGAADHRVPRFTSPMPDASLNTLLRQDAELSYLEGAKVTESHAAIRREVRAQGRLQADAPPAAAAQRRVADELRDTLRDSAAYASTLRDPAQVPVVPLFSALDTPAFVALIERLDRRCYSAGSIVFSEGEDGDSLMLVSAGQLQVFKQDEGGRPIDLARLGPGSFFGELGLLADQRRHASVRCLDDCELLELRKEVLAELTRAHPSVATTLRAFYQQRVLEMVAATSPLFRPLSPEDRERVIARFTPRRFVARELIIEQGGASAFYVLLLGEVVVTCRAASGEEIVVATLTEGDYFGEMSLISGHPAEASVRATRATETLELDGRDFYELAAIHPEIWAEVLHESRSRQELNERLLSAWKAGALLL